VGIRGGTKNESLWQANCFRCCRKTCGFGESLEKGNCGEESPRRVKKRGDAGGALVGCQGSPARLVGTKGTKPQGILKRHRQGKGRKKEEKKNLSRARTNCEQKIARGQ